MPDDDVPPEKELNLVFDTETEDDLPLDFDDEGDEDELADTPSKEKTYDWEAYDRSRGLE